MKAATHLFSSFNLGVAVWAFWLRDNVIVPDDPDFPCAMIDVRDLASWVITAAEQHFDGTFNATGSTYSLREVLTAGLTTRPLTDDEEQNVRAALTDRRA